MKFTQTNFKGMVPKYSDLLLANNYAQDAKNCKLFSGEIRPLAAPTNETTLTLDGGAIDALYLWHVGGSAP